LIEKHAEHSKQYFNNPEIGYTTEKPFPKTASDASVFVFLALKINKNPDKADS
jgi:hypothetical protein